MKVFIPNWGPLPVCPVVKEPFLVGSKVVSTLSFPSHFVPNQPGAAPAVILKTPSVEYFS